MQNEVAQAVAQSDQQDNEDVLGKYFMCLDLPSCFDWFVLGLKWLQQDTKIYCFCRIVSGLVKTDIKISLYLFLQAS